MAPDARDGERYRVAGFFRRAAAGAVDALVLTPVILTVSAVALVATGAALPRFSEIGIGYAVNLALQGGAAGPAALGLSALVAAIYFILFHALRGQTPGKRLLGLRVIDAFGERPTFVRAGLRVVGYAASAAIFSLGFFWIGFDREKRGLHDWLAGTYVVRTERAAVQAAEVTQ